MMTTAGSLALEGSIAPQDSFVAQKLREAGAVILGKTNLSEWANFRSDYSSSGWSSRGGQTNIETKGKFRETEFEVLLYEFKNDLSRYLASLGPNAPVHSLKDIIEFNERHRARVMPCFGQDVMIKSEAKGPLTGETYIKALEANHRLARDDGIDATLRKYQLDAIVAPSGGPAWLTDWVNGDAHGGGTRSASPAAVGIHHNFLPMPT